MSNASQRARELVKAINLQPDWTVEARALLSTLASDVEALEGAADMFFGEFGWRIADGSEVGVPAGSFIHSGIAPAPTKEAE